MGEPQATPQQLHFMQHALGLDDYGQGTWYRNYFTSGPDCDGWEALCALVDSGLMRRHEPLELFGDNYCFVVTEAGKRYVREHSPKPPKVSRSKARYREWLRRDTGVPFGTWLKAEAEERRAQKEKA